MKNKIAIFILRVSLGVVFLIFGIGKFRGDIWAQTIQTFDFFQKLPWPTNISVTLIGALEVITAVLLIIGLFTRWISLVASLELITILFLFSFQEIRDIGLLGATLYLAVSGQDYFGVDWILQKQRLHHEK